MYKLRVLFRNTFHHTPRPLTDEERADLFLG